MAYIVGYVCFMKGDGYFKVNTINFNAIIHLKSANFFLNLVRCNHYQVLLRYMLPKSCLNIIRKSSISKKRRLIENFY